MNQIEHLIKGRRSVRRYKPDMIATEDLQAIVRAGIWAPNAMNEQLWHFTVVSDANTIEQMNKATIAGIKKSGISFLQNKITQPEYHTFYHAPTVIVISAKKEKFTDFDCGAAAENIALAAYVKNIGSCIIGSAEFMFSENSEMHTVLKIPENYHFVCAISLGYCEKATTVSERNEDVIDYIA